MAGACCFGLNSTQISTNYQSSSLCCTEGTGGELSLGCHYLNEEELAQVREDDQE